MKEEFGGKFWRSAPPDQLELNLFSAECVCVCALVVKTFKNSTAERVPSECSQLRYTSDILEYLAARSDIPAIYFFGFAKLSAPMLVVQRVIVE